MNAATRWFAHDAQELARLAVPRDTAAALTGRGLPENAYEMFVRNTARELQVVDLPGCGPAAFLGQNQDGFWNTFWLRVEDGSIWLARGEQRQAAESASRINSCVPGLQRVLDVWCSFIGSGVMEDDDGYEGLVANTLERARNADPEAFDDEESWWSRTFEEIENGVLAPVPPGGPRHGLLERNETGEWTPAGPQEG
jgi:hypothetical protein